MQKYKVFYKSKVIVFCNITENSNLSDDNLNFINPTVLQVIDAINSCFDSLESNIKSITALVANPLEAFNEFKNHFPIIEAAGGVVSDKLGRCLMIKRLGFWDLPKGKIDLNETIENAAIREVKEETGIISISIIKQIENSYHIYFNENQNWVFKITYWFLMMGSDAKLTPQLEENITKVAWFNNIQISSRRNSTYASITEVLMNSGFLQQQ